jgi:asparagine synthase (glutamine-hydrolysing)
MCGIAGVFEYATGAPVTEEMVGQMLQSIVHRGPDDAGVHAESEVGIGARRLSIIDLPGGHQPIANEDGSVVVAFNGELYNYRELRERLQAAGHSLRSEGDTEVLVHLYEDLGDEMVHELRGMFAFAIWDARRRRLLMVRDRLGIKPLYLLDDGKRLIFGSEIKAVLRYPTAEARLDHDALAAFMLLRYVPAPRTMFAGITALEPGHRLTCDANGVRTRRWWDLSFAAMDPPPSEPEAKERLRAMLDDAVSSHMVSDVPYGAFLSGGVDSSTVVALMSRRLGRPVSTFAAGYKGAGEEVSELPYARMVADRYETDHHEVIIGAEDFVRSAEKVVWHLDQPIADDACLPNYMVSELARSHVKMALTGEGGDELFGGYARYAAERLAPVTTRMPGPMRAAVRSLASRRQGLTRPQVAAYALVERDESARMALWTPLMHPEVRAELASGELVAAANRAAPASVMGRHLERTDANDPLSRMLYVDTQHWLPDYLLARGDKTSMAASLEARVPLLDHPLVEFAATLPASLKMHGVRMSRKYLLREVARDLLPAPILSRTKKGFPVPISTWLRNGARDFCRDLLTPDVIHRRGLFDPQAIGRVLNEHQDGTADHGSLIWGLISVELWHQLYLDGPRPSTATA